MSDRRWEDARMSTQKAAETEDVAGTADSVRNARSVSPRRGRVRGRTVGVIVACVAVFAILAGLAFFANTAIGYVPVIAMPVLLLFGFMYLSAMKRSLSFTEQGPSSGSVRGDVLPFSLAVKNNSILPATRIEAVFDVSETASGGMRSSKRLLSLPPRSEKVFDLGVRFDHIGFFQVGISQVGVFDPFRVFYSLRDNETLHQVNILPRIVDISTLELSEQSLHESSKNIKTFINDGMDYSGIRDYRWGDPMKSIHWKLSSKSEADYYTRLYETPSTPAVALFVDFDCEQNDPDIVMGIYDALVESALSVEQYAASGGFDTRLLFADARGEAQDIVGPLEGRHEELMRRFPPMHAGSGRQALELVRRVSSSPNCPANLVVCTANVSEELIGALVSISGPMRSPYLIAVYSDIDGRDDMKRRLRRLEDARVLSTAVRTASDLTGGGA